jgi:hypothetical protein
VRNSGGRLVAELAKEPSVVIALGLPAGQYRVTLEQGQRLFEAVVDLRPGRPASLGPRHFAPAKRQPTVSRGDGEAERRMSGSVAGRRAG